jgi:Spy/CpxP family protein refolding chaperone
MKLRMTVECLVFLAVVAMAGNLGAQPVGANPWALAQAPNYWGLTAEQTSQIQGIVTKWQEEMQPLWASLQTKNIELQSLMWQATPDRSAVETLAREVGEIQAQIQGKSLERRNAIRGVLTAEQQTLFDQQGLGAGWGGGPGGLGMGLGWSGGFGRGWGFAGGRGRGWSMGAAPGAYGGYGGAFYGRGRGPCGMGLAAGPMGPWMGRQRW